MKKNGKIRVGFIGAGNICRQRHLPGLMACEDVEIVAVCNRSVASSQAVAEAFGIGEIEEDWQRLVAREDLDAVFIGTWPYMHCTLASAVLSSGKHCFCQARMCMNLEQARQMVEVAGAHRELVSMICPPPMRMPFEPWIRKMIGHTNPTGYDDEVANPGEGELGELTLVTLHVADGSNLDPTRLSWREDVRYSGQHALLMGIFAETLNAWVGPYETLSASMTIPMPFKKTEAEGEVQVQVPQVVTIQGQLTCGALCVEHHTGLATDRSTPGMQLRIYGSRGTIAYDFGQTIEFAPAGESFKTVAVESALQRPWQVEADFIQAVRHARAGKTWQVSPDFEEGLAYMKKVHAVHLSAKTGQAVSLSEL